VRQMKTAPLRGSRIVGLGHSQPDRVLTNDELSTMVETDDAWITTRTGIKTRRIAGPDDTVTSMATAAARNALADAGVDPASVDLVVVASTTHEDRAPYTAGRVAVQLGMTSGPAPIDINTACSGFEYAMAVADQAIRTGAADTAVVVGADKLSGITDWTDRSTCVLVGDGAGAAVLQSPCSCRCRGGASRTSRTPCGSPGRRRGSSRRAARSTAGRSPRPKGTHARSSRQQG
jgi:3-oxoacyl-[acyl-carrier-protein] synthase-3